MLFAPHPPAVITIPAEPKQTFRITLVTALVRLPLVPLFFRKFLINPAVVAELATTTVLTDLNTHR